MMFEKCKRCNREFIQVETLHDMQKAIMMKKSFKLQEKKEALNTIREYCGFCGAWVK